MLNFLFLVIGILLLTAGGDFLIRGSLGAARRMNVSALFSGLVIVGFGTSVPELIVSIEAAMSAKPDISIGNVVGSNIGNIFLILGLCAIIHPMKVSKLALSRDAITVVGVSILFSFLIFDKMLGLTNAIVLLFFLITYLVWAYRSESKEITPVGEVHIRESEEVSKVPTSVSYIIGALIAGLILLIFGSQILIKGAVGIASYLGVSESVIGLTLVAVGTSLPELTVSMMAAIRKHADVAVGNVLGSNIFNLLGILGISGLLQPLPINTRIFHFDQWVMLGASMMLLLFLFTCKRLNRLEGAILLFLYIVYVVLSFSVLG